MRKRADAVRRHLAIAGAACLVATAVTSAGCAKIHVRAAVAESVRYMTEASDVERYFAYCNATLGRPYHSYYVRSSDEWRGVFARGDDEIRMDFPIVRPARALVPYRDFLVEYPPGLLLVSMPLTLVAETPRTYVTLFGFFMAALMIAAAILCARIAPLAGARLSRTVLVTWVVIASVCLGALVTQRSDATVALLVCVMCWATLARRPVVLGVAAGAAVAIKIMPVLAAAMCAIHLIREHRWRELRTATALAIVTAVAISAPILAAAPAGLFEMARYHIDRPLEIGSTAATLLAVWHSVDPSAVAISNTFGSINIVGRLSGTAMIVTRVALVAGLFLVYGVAWRRFGAARTPSGRARELLTATVAVLAVFIATSKVGSPQYLSWLLPLGVLVSLLDGRRSSLVLLLTTLLLAQIVYAEIPGAVAHLRPWASWVALPRNLLLMAWTWGVAAHSAEPVASTSTVASGMAASPRVRPPSHAFSAH